MPIHNQIKTTVQFPEQSIVQKEQSYNALFGIYNYSIILPYSKHSIYPEIVVEELSNMVDKYVFDLNENSFGSKPKFYSDSSNPLCRSITNSE